MHTHAAARTLERASIALRVALSCALTVGTLIPRLAAAQGGVVVRGSVSDPAGGTLGYSVVSIVPGGGRILTDDEGRFVFAGLDPGSYRVTARHLGFLPLDTIVTVSADAGPPLALRLARLTVQLAAIRVVAPGPCLNPGPPDPATEPTLAAIFGQLRENADRAVALGRQFPFVVAMERKLTEQTPSGRAQPVGLDTVVVDGSVTWPYHAGQLVAIVNEHGRNVRQLNLPGLVQLADSGFHSSHCFSYGGVEKVRGERLIRIDFAADRRLEQPDIAGTAYLDTEGYQVRRIVMTLTRPERLDPTIASMEVTSLFREIVPSIVILDSADGVTSFEMPTGPALVRTERQRTVKVVFARATPRGAILP